MAKENTILNAPGANSTDPTQNNNADLGDNGALQNAPNPDGQSNSEEVSVVQTTNLTIVLGGVGCTEELLRASILAWSKYVPEAKILSIGEGADIECKCKANNRIYDEQVLAAIACELVPEAFIFVPAFTMPTSRCLIADLMVVKGWGIPTYDVIQSIKAFAGATVSIVDVMPLLIEKSKAVSVFEVLDRKKYKFDFVLAYASMHYADVIPFDVAPATTNITGLVLRPNPNSEIVSKFLKERKFLVFSNDGFVATKDLILEHLQ